MGTILNGIKGGEKPHPMHIDTDSEQREYFKGAPIHRVSKRFFNEFEQLRVRLDGLELRKF